LSFALKNADPVSPPATQTVKINGQVIENLPAAAASFFAAFFSWEYFYKLFGMK